MLGDQAEKTKNPLKSAMRRRKAKTVAFAAPTYVDYSDIEYSTDEEDIEAEYFAQQSQQQQQQQQDEQEGEHKEEAQQQSLRDQQHATAAGVRDDVIGDEAIKVEPLKTRGTKENGKVGDTKRDDPNGDAAGGKGLTRTSEEIFVASKSETPGPKRTKDGTVRDSFFKDDTVETKKITLTPNLLRDDSTPRASSESKDMKQRPSLDRLDKDINSLLVKDDKKKKDKKEKDKKPSGFRSLFSRKDKKRSDNDDDESFGKRSMDIGSEGVDRERDDDVDEDSIQESNSPSTLGPQRQPSKLQKQQPPGRFADVSPTAKAPSNGAAQKDSGRKITALRSRRLYLLNYNLTDLSLPTVRMVESDSVRDGSSQESSPRDSSPFSSASKATTMSNGASSIAESSRPQVVAKATARAVLDEFDSEEEETPIAEAPRKAPATDEDLEQRLAEARPAQQPAGKGLSGSVNGLSTGKSIRAERLSESPVQISPVNSNIPPALMVDTSSQEEHSSPISSPSPSPELVESEDRSGHHAEDSITTSTSTTTANTATWNDASLRAFFDSGTDVRDLLVVVYDKSDVAPVGPDHPVAGSLFKDQNAKLAEITNVSLLVCSSACLCTSRVFATVLTRTATGQHARRLACPQATVTRHPVASTRTHPFPLSLYLMHDMLVLCVFHVYDYSPTVAEFTRLAELHVI